MFAFVYGEPLSSATGPQAVRCELARRTSFPFFIVSFFFFGCRKCESTYESVPYLADSALRRLFVFNKFN